MAADSPLTSLTLAAGSVADDLGYVALKDLSKVLGDIAAEYRVIGGHMVTVLAARWRLGRPQLIRPAPGPQRHARVAAALSSRSQSRGARCQATMSCSRKFVS